MTTRLSTARLARLSALHPWRVLSIWLLVLVVAIGLALSLAEEQVFRQAAAVLVTVFVGATLLCEIIGPFATRFAVNPAGELAPHRERAEP